MAKPKMAKKPRKTRRAKKTLQRKKEGASGEMLLDRMARTPESWLGGACGQMSGGWWGFSLRGRG